MKEENNEFEKIIEAVGNDGIFHRRYNWFFNFGLIFISCIVHMNLILIVYAPDHWCYVPGREETNYTIEEWKNINIPREEEDMINTNYQKCKMLNISEPYSDFCDCKFGWEYDTTWYKSTISIQENWVCDKALYGTNILGLTRVGEIIGTFIYGQLADSIGRKTVFYITLLNSLVGKLLMLVTTKWIYVFSFIIIVSSLPATSLFQAPLIVAMEITKTESRGRIAMIQCTGWTLGLSLMPLLFWAIGDWYYFVIGTTAPLGLFLLLKSYIIESPRWLAGKGRTKEAIKVLKRIAKINKTKVSDDIHNLLMKKDVKKEKVYGVLSLVSNWRLAKNSFALIYLWCATILTYLILFYNASNIGGNPFLNLFFQSIAELPGAASAKIISDKFGRRFCSVFAFTGTTLACIPIIFFIGSEENSLVVSISSILFKFSLASAFFSTNIQSLEVFPTCIRQTGMSIGPIVGNIFGILPPYIIHLGTEIHLSIPYIICAIISIFAIICGIILPETLNYKLPESLADAAVFGKNQNFFGKEIKEDKDEVETPLQFKDFK